MSYKTCPLCGAAEESRREVQIRHDRTSELDAERHHLRVENESLRKAMISYARARGMANPETFPDSVLVTWADEEAEAIT